jgi:hypothetical protein
MYHVPSVAHPFRQLLRWWGASLLGSGLSGCLSFFLAWRVLSPDVATDISWILGATSAAIGQALVLPTGLLSRTRWIVITFLGASLSIGFAVLSGILSQKGRVADGSVRQVIVSSVLLMLVLGLCQAGYLRRSVSGTGWLVSAAVVGGLLDGLLNLGLAQGMSAYQPTSPTAAMLLWSVTTGVTWMSLTALTGVVVVYSLHPRTQHGVVVAATDGHTEHPVAQDSMPVEQQVKR